jgi:hypothetical protein
MLCVQIIVSFVPQLETFVSISDNKKAVSLAHENIKADIIGILFIYNNIHMQRGEGSRQRAEFVFGRRAV